MKRIIALALCIPALLSGCSIRQLSGMELSGRLIVEAIGIDAQSDGVTLTLQAIDPAPAEPETGTEGKQKSVNYSFTAETVAQAVALAAQITGKAPFFAYARILLFGKKTTEAGLTDTLDFFLRNRTVRNTVPVCAAKTTARALLDTAQSAAGSPAQTIAQTLLACAEQGHCVLAPFFSFINRMRAPDTEAFCPLISVDVPSEDEPLLLSCEETAVFSGDRYHFTLSGNDTLYFSLAHSAAKDVLYKIHTDRGVFDCRLRKIKTKIQIKNNTAELSVRARSNLVDAAGQAPLPASKNDPPLLNQTLRDTLRTNLENCLNRIYGEYGADLLRLRKKCGLPADAPPDSFKILCTVRITE